MVGTGNCLGKPILNDLTYDSSYFLHFFKRESIAACKITRCARWNNITFDVRFVVINSVQSSWCIQGAAMSTGLHNQSMYFSSRHVARINAFIRLTQKHSSTFVCFAVPLIALFCFCFLIDSHQLPTIWPIVTTTLALAMALFAFVRQTQRSGFVAQKEVSRSRQNLLTTMTFSCIGSVVDIYAHAPNYTRRSPRKTHP